MSIFNNDEQLEAENARLKCDVSVLKMQIECLQQEKDAELEYLREAIKPYVDYIKCPDLQFGENHFATARTLKEVEKEISEFNLYVAVLEGDLGPERTEAAKKKYRALKELKS